MAHYILKRYRRTRPGETRGVYDGTIIEFDAPDQEQAVQQGRIEAENVNWQTYFVGLWSDDEQFISFWGGPTHA